MAVPEVINSAATAPVSGHGLGSTMWYACAWCAIFLTRFPVDISLVAGQTRKPELLLPLFLTP